MSASYRVSFPENEEYPPVELPADASLAERFDVSNSPVLFGCRTGICGTCLVEVVPDAPLPAPDAYEKEVLDIYAPDNPRARLCCQVKLRANCAITILFP
jgi:ferredoxin